MFRDRIITNGEMEALDGMVADTAKKYLSEFQVSTIEAAGVTRNTCSRGSVAQCIARYIRDS